MTTFAKEAAAIIKKRTNNFTPKIGMILGSLKFLMKNCLVLACLVLLGTPK
jgi:hypothetical protein